MKGPAVAARRRSLPMRIEPLEGRMLLATITVNRTADQLFQDPHATVEVLKEPGIPVSLLDAINIANNSPGANTIELQPFKTYRLDKIDNYWYGPNGLPAISSQITIEGHGATIERSGGPDFRFFYVSNHQYGGLPDGSLTLHYLTLQGGYAHGGNSRQGGGGLGAGGAIFNQGTLALESVLLTDNTAHGGNSQLSIQSKLGGGIGQDSGGFGGPLPGASPGFATDGGPAREGQGGRDGRAGFGGGGGDGRSGGPGGFGGGGSSGGNAGYGSEFGGGGGGATNPNGYGGRGGGGAGLGGAIFNRGGTVSIVNSTLAKNSGHGGDGSNGSFENQSGAGSAFGGAIFNLNGTVRLLQDTIAANSLNGGSGFGGRTDGYQVYNLAFSFAGVTASATLTLANTILDGAPSWGKDLVNQTFANGTNNRANVANANPTTVAKNNIITRVANLDGNFVDGSGGSRGVVSVSYMAADAGLQGLNNNGGRSRTMALYSDSPARDAGLVSLAIDAQDNRLLYDQRGPRFPRTRTRSLIDIGALQSQVGLGRSRLVGTAALGMIRVAPSASGEALRDLRGGFKLAGLRAVQGSRPAPIVVGAAALANPRVVAELKASYQAGQTVAITDATPQAAARLSTLLGHQNPAQWASSLPRAALVAFRKAAVAGGPAQSETTVVLPTKPGTAGVPLAAGRRQPDQQVLRWLTPVFAAVPSVSSPTVADSPSDPINLLNVVNAYTSRAIGDDEAGDAVQITNTVYDVRSFAKKADFFYVQQEIDQKVAKRSGNTVSQAVSDTTTALKAAPAKFPTLIQPRPQSTSETKSSTTSIGFSLGISVGYQSGEGGGLNGSVSGTFSFSKSWTTTYPSIDIRNLTNPETGVTRWQAGLHSPPREGNFTNNFVNGWIWQIPWTDYRVAQPSIAFSTDSSLLMQDELAPPAVEVHLDSIVPLPFGNTFALQPPKVASLSTASVKEGQTFTINGSGFYPSLVKAVVIGGQPLPQANYQVLSDTKITVIAPKSTGKAEPVIVSTSVEPYVSNDDVKITVSPS